MSSTSPAAPPYWVLDPPSSDPGHDALSLPSRVTGPWSGHRSATSLRLRRTGPSDRTHRTGFRSRHRIVPGSPSNPPNEHHRVRRSSEAPWRPTAGRTRRRSPGSTLRRPWRDVPPTRRGGNSGHSGVCSTEARASSSRPVYATRFTAHPFSVSVKRPIRPRPRHTVLHHTTTSAVPEATVERVGEPWPTPVVGHEVYSRSEPRTVLRSTVVGARLVDHRARRHGGPPPSPTRSMRPEPTPPCPLFSFVPCPLSVGSTTAPSARPSNSRRHRATSEARRALRRRSEFPGCPVHIVLTTPR